MEELVTVFWVYPLRSNYCVDPLFSHGSIVCKFYFIFITDTVLSLFNDRNSNHLDSCQRREYHDVMFLFFDL